MKKLILTILVVNAVGIVAPAVNAQMFTPDEAEGSRLEAEEFSGSTIDWEEVMEHTLLGERAGKELWDQLQSKEITCEDLSNEQFSALGEYFMGQMMGESHATMNAMMIQMHGEEGEEQIHIAMGKRLSGCDTEASFALGSSGWMPMMNMMWGGWSSPLEFNNQPNKTMMNFGFAPFGVFGWIFMILWWALIIVGGIAFIKWLMSQSHGASGNDKSALGILKERYAKGEIDKEEFEEKRRNLTE